MDISPQALADAAYAFGLWTGWALLHSILATRRVKAAFEVALGPRFALYPLGYTMLSLWTFWLVFTMEPDLPQLIWVVEGLPAFALYALQAAGLGVLVWAGLSVGGFKMLGLRQLADMLRGRVPDERYPVRDFSSTGAYGFVRHPMHLGGALFLLCQPRLTLGMLVFAVFACLYFAVGSALEERRLSQALGPVWADYVRRVPMYLPWPRPPRG